MERDPVCGMTVDKQKAAGTSEYKGKTYYFCSAGCKRAFDRNPEQFLGGSSAHGEHGGHGHH
ncbi:MAG: YHS domain-containing protein [Chloroflexi bacterium]|nr:YHS domain-containing protein [Chloroflexota bacterium]